MKPNGFTLIQALLVLLIVCMMSMMAIPFYQRPATPSRVFMKQMEMDLLSLQIDSFTNARKNTFSLLQEGYFRQEEWIALPKTLACEPAVFHWNEKGNIAMAGTIHCQDDESLYRLVLQVESGQIRLEQELR